MDKLVGADRMATVTQISTQNSCGEQKSITKCTTRCMLRVDGLQLQKTIVGSTPVSQNKKIEAADSWKHSLV